MRAVVQRVKKARVEVAGEVVAETGAGLLVLLGVAKGDAAQDAERLALKIMNLRIFEDDEGKMNRSALDVKAEMLVVSQFTLLADTERGRRPSFTQAASPEVATRLYEHFVAICLAAGMQVQTGEFQARMDVSLINSGPVTIILDSKRAI
jgi:D-tyrosyl-tRNA(Tyr) deacylase